MIDSDVSNLINNFNLRSEDALGYNSPGYQPKFHDVLNSQVRSIRSDDPLSVVAPENTFFVVDNGDGSHSYTRSGDFRVAQGQLVTRDGRAVLGYPNGIEKGTLAPLTVPEGTPDGNVHISADGTVSFGTGTATPGKAIAATTPLAAPVTDARQSEHLAAPAGADARSYDVPDLDTLNGDQKMSAVSLPADTTGRFDPRALVAKSGVKGDASVMDDGGSAGVIGANYSRVSTDGSAPSTSTDEATAGSLLAGVARPSNEPTGIGTPIGKIALARFANGSVVNTDGRSTSGPPLEMGPPGTGRITALKTNARDVGSVDHIASILKVHESTQLLNAMLQIETARQGNAKKVMDLIK